MVNDNDPHKWHSHDSLIGYSQVTFTSITNKTTAAQQQLQHYDQRVMKLIEATLWI